jgi:hypothetical protein
MKLFSFLLRTMKTKLETRALEYIENNSNYSGERKQRLKQIVTFILHTQGGENEF